MSRSLTVTLYTSAAAGGQDVSAYLTPDWQGRIAAESSLCGYEAGTLSFRIEDKLTPASVRYWSNRIQTSTAFTLSDGFRTDVPYIEVHDATITDDKKLLFAGFVERNQLRWDGDQLTGFTAVSQLSYMDRLDMAASNNPANKQICSGSGSGSGYTWTQATWGTTSGDYLNEGVLPGDRLHVGGNVYVVSSVTSATVLVMTTSIDGVSGSSYLTRSALTTYSGPMLPLVRRAIRMGGNISPNSSRSEGADVVIDAYPLGTAQGDSDWVHVIREWANAGTDPGRALPPSDFLPSVSGNRLGFICVDGKLCRVDITKTGLSLTQITVLPANQSASIYAGYRLFPFSMADGTECMMIAQAVVRTIYNRAYERLLDPYVAAASTGAQAALGVYKKTAQLAGGVAIGEGFLKGVLGMLVHRVKCSPSGKALAITRVHVMSIGDGTNDPATGVGAAVNLQLPADKHGYSADIYTPGDSICTVAGASGESSRIVLVRYVASTNNSWVQGYYYKAGRWEDPAQNRLGNRRFYGPPVGGIAARAYSGDWMVAVSTSDELKVRQLLGSTQTSSTLFDREVARFCSAITLDNGNLAFVATQDSDEFFVWNGSSLEAANITGTPDNFALVSCAYQPRVANSTNGVPVLYRKTNSKGEQYLYAGWLYDNGSGGLTLDETLCPEAVPGAHAAETTTPLMFLDSGTGSWIYRFATFTMSLSGNRVVTDGFLSDLWVRFFVHHDFAAHPTTVRAFIENCGRACLAFVKLVDRARPTVTGDYKFQTRWSIAVPETGYTMGKDQNAVNRNQPQIDGTEFYLATMADCYGENIRPSGVTPGGRHTYAHQSTFLQPAQARVLGAWIVTAYPERDTNYPYGRRRVSADMHYLENDDDGAEVTPNIAILNRSLTLECFPSSTITAIVTGLTFNKSTHCYEAEFIEYNADDMVDPTAEPDPTLAALVLVAEVTVTPGAAGTSNKLLWPWHVHHVNVNVPHANPTVAAYAWARTCHLPHGCNLSHYSYKLLSAGTSSMGGLAMAIWTAVDGRPGAEIVGTRAIALHDTRDAGMNYQEIFRLTDDDPTSYYLAPGLYWLVCVVDQQATATPINPPDITWLNALSPCPEQAYYMPMGDGVLLSWPTTWDTGTEVVTQFAPDVQPVEVF